MEYGPLRMIKFMNENPSFSIRNILLSVDDQKWEFH